MPPDTTTSYLKNSQAPDLYIPDHILQEGEVKEDQTTLFKRAAKDVGRFVASGDIITAPVHGVIEAGNQALKAADSLGNWVADKTGLPLNPYIQLHDQQGHFHPHLYKDRQALEEAGGQPFELPNVVPPETTTGNLVSSAAQFLTGFIPALRGVKALGGVDKAAKTAGLGSATTARLEAATAGALTDFAIFDPYQMRLSNLMAEHGSEALKPFFDYLKAKDTDTELEGRLKQAAEGLGVGAATAGILSTFRTLRRFYTHRERVKALTGQAYEAPDELLKAARNLALSESPEALPRACQEWAEILKSESWQALPEAARKDLESLILKNTHLTPELQALIAENQAQRHIQSEALVNSSQLLGAEEALERFKAGEAPEALRSWSQGQYQALKDALQAPDTESASKIIGRGINFKYIQTDEDTVRLIKAVQKLAADDINKATGNVRGWRETEEIADILGKDPKQVQISLMTLFNTTQLMDGDIRAANLYLHSLFNHLQSRARQADLGLLDESGLLEFVRLQTVAEQTLVMFQGVKSNMARALNALKIPVTYNELSPGEMADLLTSVGGAEHQRRIAKLIASAQGPKDIAKLVKPTAYQRGRDAMVEYFINSILSGPTTHAVNVISTALNSAYQPLERIAGGILGGDKSLIHEGASMYKALVGGITDILKISSKGLRLNEDSPYAGALKAFWHGRNLLDQSTSLYDKGLPPRAISAQGFGLSTPSLLKAIEQRKYGQAFQASLAHSLDFAGKVINLPGRFLMAEDEFFKVLNYRMELGAQATRLVKEAAEKGESVEGLFERIMAEPQSFGLHEVALNYARQATFTSPLRSGVGQWLVEGTHRFPELKLIMPFIRTPINILKFVHQRTPFLNLASREFRQELFSSDPTIKNLALGKLSMGWMLWASALSLAKDGRIQGGFPNKPGRREAAENAGVLEYSFVTTDKDGKKHYTQFNRLDPFGIFFSLSADMAEIMGQLDDKDADHLATAAVIALSRNLNARSYFTGLTHLLNALAEGDRHGARFIESYATALIPNFVKQTRKTSKALWGDNQDPYKRITPAFRDLESLLEILKSQLPGYSKEFPKALNIFGEEISYPVGFGASTLNPFYSSQEKDNPIALEMFRLGMGAKPPSDRLGTVRLTPGQQQDYIKFSAHPSSKSLKATLNAFISSPDYQALPEGSDEGEGTKQYLIKQILAKYRAMGRHLLLEKYPDLKQAVIKENLEQRKIS